MYSCIYLFIYTHELSEIRVMTGDNKHEEMM